MYFDKGMTETVLSTPNLAAALLEREWDRYLTLCEASTKVTAVLTGMPRGGGAEKNATLAKLADAEGYVDDAKSMEAHLKAAVRCLINVAPITDVQKTILKARYADKLPWNRVHKILADNGKTISERQMYRLYDSAVVKVTEFLAEVAEDL